MKKNKTTEAIVDIGDTVGGILVGYGMASDNNAMILGGVMTILAMVVLKYIKGTL